MNKLQTFLRNNYIALLIFLAILVVYGLSSYKRQADYWYWLENSQDYVVENVTAMTTLDAYYWLKMARELDNGTLGKATTKGYPDLVPLALKDKPGLLAKFISFGKNFTGGDYYRAGLLLVTVLSGLFIFPLFFYFQRLGFGASAVLGGLVGTFGHAYYDRTMMGRVDTDLLNTFFPLAVACFILPMTREKTLRANISLAVGAGLTMYLFTQWYQMPAFILVYLFVIALYLLLGRVHWKHIVPILLVYLLLSGPNNLLQIMGSIQTFIKAYISPPPTGHIAWPNILHTVAEAQTRSITMKLNMLHGFWPIVFAGFSGLIYLSFRRFRQMIPVTPVLILSAWAMTGPSRFVMYLAPFIGVGAGVLIELLMKYVGGKIRIRLLPLTLISISFMFVLFFSTARYTSFYQHTAPSIPADTTKALLDIKKIVPKNSAMFTPFWEYGYALMEIGEFATYHDGGLQGGIRSTLTAKAMTSKRQKEMVSLLSYLEDNGFKQLSSRIRKEKISADKMMEIVFNYPGNFQGENTYVLYLEKMIWKFSPMSYFGNWDFDKKKSDTMDYVELFCKSLVNNIITCSDGTINLARGLMNDGTVDIPLRAALFVNDGYVVDQKNYPRNEGYYLQVLMKKGKVYMTLVADERLFLTNFNQQFLLGNYDRRYFEEVYNNFPVARVLKVKRN
ncbi:STT3 domain-containing protein [Thermodesulfobacteriota bacterium]